MRISRQVDSHVAADFATAGVRLGTMWDVYTRVLVPFGKLLTDMEAAGMAVDRWVGGGGGAPRGGGWVPVGGHVGGCVQVGRAGACTWQCRGGEEKSRRGARGARGMKVPPAPRALALSAWQHSMGLVGTSYVATAGTLWGRGVPATRLPCVTLRCNCFLTRRLCMLLGITEAALIHPRPPPAVPHVPQGPANALNPPLWPHATTTPPPHTHTPTPHPHVGSTWRGRSSAPRRSRPRRWSASAPGRPPRCRTRSG